MANQRRAFRRIILSLILRLLLMCPHCGPRRRQPPSGLRALIANVAASCLMTSTGLVISTSDVAGHVGLRPDDVGGRCLCHVISRGGAAWSEMKFTVVILPP